MILNRLKLIKPSIEVNETFSKRNGKLTKKSEQHQSKLKFGRLKFENFDPTRPNQDPTAKSEAFNAATTILRIGLINTIIGVVGKILK